MSKMDGAVARALAERLFLGELAESDVGVVTDIVHFWASNPGEFQFKSEIQRMLAMKIATRRRESQL